MIMIFQKKQRIFSFSTKEISIYSSSFNFFQISDRNTKNQKMDDNLSFEL